MKDNKEFKERQKVVARYFINDLDYHKKKMLASLLVDENTVKVLQDVSDKEMQQQQEILMKVLDKGVIKIDKFLISEVEIMHELYDDKCSFWFDNPNFEYGKVHDDKVNAALNAFSHGLFS